MKRLLITFLLTMLLAGCSLSANSNNVIELLSSPRLSESENEIVSALSLYSNQEVVFKYLKEGENVSPIQYIDIDENNVDEAIVFYTAPSTSGYVRMAVLHDNDGVWEVVDDIEGPGSEVLNLSLIQFDKSKGNQLLVTYSFANTLEKMVTVYYYEEGHLVNPYSQLCQSYIVSDVTQDGNVDLITGQLNLENKFPDIKLISLNDEKEIGVVAQYQLNVANVDIQSMKLSKSSKSDAPAVVIDYKDNQNVIHTQAISYIENEFVSVLENESIQKLWEYDYPIISIDVNADNYIETATIIKAEESQTLDYMEWTSFLIEPIERELFGVVDSENQIFISMPEEWQGYIHLSEKSSIEWQVFKREENPDYIKVEEDTQEIQQGSNETENETVESEFIISEELVSIRVINPGTAFYKNDDEEIFDVGILRVALSFSEEVSQEQKEIIYNNMIYLG